MENSSLHAVNSRPILLAVLFLSLLLSITACTKQSRSTSQAQNQQSQSSLKATSQQPPRVNINTASAQELEALPGIGKALAERIIEHREKYGPFRKPEHLLIVRGISDKRFQNLRGLIAVE
jgi:competence ComEA-like helix-hairpin-helix protein